jgi:hypothetical protein
MAYTTINYLTKKALREAVLKGQRVTVYQPNGDLTGAHTPENGVVYLEGPHYPKAHTWYAEATVKDGIIVKVK